MNASDHDLLHAWAERAYLADEIDVEEFERLVGLAVGRTPLRDLGAEDRVIRRTAALRD